MQTRLRKTWPPKHMPPSLASAGWQCHSATWEPCSAPGLLLSRGPLEDGRLAWQFACPVADWRDNHPAYVVALGLWPSLAGQLFSTRREAVEALAVLLALQADSERSA